MLHKRVGLVFILFSAFSLVTNVFTPGNPDHVMNVIEQSCLILVFALSYFLHQPAAGVLQIITLATTAFIPMHLNDSPFFGAVIAVFALILIHAYGGYRAHVWWKLPTTFFTLFSLCAIARSNFTPPSSEMWIGAFAWTMFICIFCFVLWLVVADMERKIHLESKSEIERNRAELESIKKEVRECNHATGS